jgi:hypothetical protein
MLQEGYLQQRNMIPKLPRIPRRRIQTRIPNHSPHDQMRDLALVQQKIEICVCETTGGLRLVWYLFYPASPYPLQRAGDRREKG